MKKLFFASYKLHLRCNTSLFNGKLRSFNVDKTILTLFYICSVQSVLTISVVRWWGNLIISDKSKLQKLVNICSKITGWQQLSFSNIFDRQVFKEAKQISNDHTHFLSPEYELLLSKKCFRFPECKTNRRCFSFNLVSIHLLNDLAD